MRHPEEVGDSNCSPTSMSVSNSDMQDSRKQTGGENRASEMLYTSWQTYRPY